MFGMCFSGKEPVKKLKEEAKPLPAGSAKRAELGIAVPTVSESAGSPKPAWSDTSHTSGEAKTVAGELKGAGREPLSGTLKLKIISDTTLKNILEQLAHFKEIYSEQTPERGDGGISSVETVLFQKVKRGIKKCFDEFEVRIEKLDFNHPIAQEIFNVLIEIYYIAAQRDKVLARTDTGGLKELKNLLLLFETAKNPHGKEISRHLEAVVQTLKDEERSTKEFKPSARPGRP